MLTTVLFLVIGLLLVVLEILVIPGSTIVGIAGFLTMATGVYKAFAISLWWGLSALLGVTVASGLSLWAFFKFELWKWYSQQNKIDARVNEEAFNAVQLGQVGITLSALRPSGMVNFEHGVVEVTTYGLYIEAGKSVKVISIANKRILVEPNNTTN